MAGDWIKVLSATPDKPEVFQISADLNICADAVLGKLVRLWIWADQQIATRDGNGLVTVAELPIGSSVAARALIDRVCGQTGFADALSKVGWLELSAHAASLPNFTRHNGNSAKSRALTAQRVAKHKQKVTGPGNGKVTDDQLPRRYLEKKREREDNTNTKTTSERTADQVERPADQVVFRLAGDRTATVDQAMIGEWTALYGSEFVAVEMAKCAAWCAANAQKRSRNITGLKRRINSWLARASTTKPRSAAVELTVDDLFGAKDDRD